MSLTPSERERELLAIVQPLIEFFGEIDDVFSEDDAMSAEKRQMGMGRCYRAWQRIRAVVDDEYEPGEDNREYRPTGRGVRRADGTVLQSRTRRASGTWQS